MKQKKMADIVKGEHKNSLSPGTSNIQRITPSSLNF